jgi:hypothetical protein
LPQFNPRPVGFGDGIYKKSTAKTPSLPRIKNGNATITLKISGGSVS